MKILPAEAELFHADGQIDSQMNEQANITNLIFFIPLCQVDIIY